MLALTLALLSSPPPTPVGTLFVDLNAPNCLGANGTQQLPYCTIGEALAVSTGGDEIRIAAGTYFERLNVTSSVVLHGTGGAAVTTIDAGGLGIAVRSAPGVGLVINGLTVTGGRGQYAGGVAAAGPSMLLNSTISGNRADMSYGGGGWNTYYSSGTAIGCTFDGNQAMSNFYGSSAIHSTYGILTIEDSTITGNVATGTWASTVMAFDTNLIVRNTTISGNMGIGVNFVEYGASGQLYSATITDSTITMNTGGGLGGGLRTYGGGPVRLRNTIVAANTGLGVSTDLHGPFQSLGYNLIGDDSGSSGLANGVGGDQVGSGAAPLDAQLEPLADNGGSTLTHAPLASSPVVDRGHPSLFEAVDQRGVPRPAGLVDIGAHERRIGTPNTSCTPVPNSTGRVARTVTSGSLVPAANTAWVSMLSLPRDAFGYFLTSQASGVVMNPNGSQGTLCLGGAIGRFVGPGQIQSSGQAGRIVLPLDLTQHPTPTGLVVVQPGETWFLQGWYRDVVNGVPTSNFSEGVGVSFL